MHGDELAQHAVIADDGPGLFPFVFQVLRHSTDDGGREDMAVITDDDVIIDIGERIDRDVLSDLSLWAHIC